MLLTLFFKFAGIAFENSKMAKSSEGIFHILTYYFFPLASFSSEVKTACEFRNEGLNFATNLSTNKVDCKVRDLYMYSLNFNSTDILKRSFKFDCNIGILPFLNWPTGKEAPNNI